MLASSTWRPMLALPGHRSAVAAREGTLSERRASKPRAGNAAPRAGGGCLRRLLVVALGVMAALVVLLWLAFVAIEGQLPEVFSYQDYRAIALQSSRVYAAGGEALARFGPENRTVIGPKQIPDTLRFAVVAAEDAAFYHHPGLDLLGIARAIWVDLRAGGYKQGASTITQQFAKTRFLSAEKSILRKLRELVLARKIELRAGKDEILAMYLNEIYYGHGAHGCEEAARLYFGKGVAQLDLAEAAMLAGVINAPGRWSPLRHPEKAKVRRAYVLGQMRDRGYIGAEDAARATAAPLPQRAHEDIGLRAPWVVMAVRGELERLVEAGVLDRAAWERGGLRIEVGIDALAQQAAEAAAREGLLTIDRAQRVVVPATRLGSEAEIASAIERLRKARAPRSQPGPAIAQGVVVGRVGGGASRAAGSAAVEPGYELDLGGERGVLLDSGLSRYVEAAGEPAAALWRRGDVLRVSVLERQGERLTLVVDQGPQLALVAIEPQTRLVRALIGGDDPRLHPFHRALAALRQPGSTFKTFVYGAAIESGAFRAESLVRDERRAHRSGGRLWTPRNFGDRWTGKDHTLRDALARSINSVAVAVAEQVGPQEVAAFARKLGVQSPLQADLPLALGASSVRPLELANAYATLAADGVMAAPILVTRVLDRDDRELFRAKPTPQRVIAADLARTLTDMLGEVVRRGSAKSLSLAHPVAGKTGTTNGGRDAWFVGYTKGLCAAVWVGHDDRLPMPEASGANTALPIWGAFMRRALDRMPVQPLARLPHLGVAVEPAPLEGDPELGAQALEGVEEIVR